MNNERTLGAAYIIDAAVDEERGIVGLGAVEGTLRWAASGELRGRQL